MYIYIYTYVCIYICLYTYTNLCVICADRFKLPQVKSTGGWQSVENGARLVCEASKAPDALEERLKACGGTRRFGGDRWMGSDPISQKEMMTNAANPLDAGPSKSSADFEPVV